MGSISGKRFGNYILYAIGEIVLVVLGILIAVGINNWNEDKKEADRLATYLHNYRTDLVTDTTVIGINLRLLEQKKEAFHLVLSDTMTKQQLMTTPLAFSLITTHRPLQLQNKGYNELKNYASNDRTMTDSLVSTIITTHAAFDDLIMQAQERINKDIDENLGYFKNNKEWMADLLSQKLSDDVIAYFLSDDYRNRASLHYVLVYKNLHTFLSAYNDHAIGLLERIDERLSKTP
ncbi:hypothetical protein C8D94_10336 [Marinirhabdus gelatinilytica]|uniref:Uncharacterized protein n=2 Tax=Marinirhabdus gelatinilytica TaxID=1703343 RepID=A0A370QA16_9FLAO|nr:hypothetical protein C8D94_10336 [Marinirhabdus gelatinilytica]